MKVIAILTLMQGGVYAYRLRTMDTGMSRSMIFDHMRELMIGDLGPQWANAAVISFYCEPDDLT